MLMGEHVDQVWVVDAAARHLVTPSRGLLHDVRKLEKPKTFGLADKKTLMKANELGNIEVRLISGRKADLRDLQDMHMAELWIA
jgi:hypothetical protein